MSGRYLLDTSIIISLFANDSAVTRYLSNAKEVFIPCVVIGELYYGALKSTRIKENIGRVNDFAAHNVILGCDTETARCYGELKHQLRQKGRPIPENDIWIAAISVQHDLSLVTRDTHFREVERLSIETW